MGEVEVHYMDAEEWEAVKARLLAQLKAIPNWQSKLATCHIKCSDIYPPLRVALWMNLNKEEIAELYKEAGRD